MIELIRMLTLASREQHVPILAIEWAFVNGEIMVTFRPRLGDR